MVSRHFFISLTSLLVIELTFSAAGFSQDLPRALKTSRELFEMTEDQTRTYAQVILSGGLQEYHSDELILLAMNRSQIIVPELVAAIKNALTQAEPDERFVYKMGDVIAYAADESAIDGLAQLCDVDERRFGYFLKRSLTYATGRRNSFALAYQAFEKLGARNQLVIEWAQSAVSSESYQQQWAAALFERYKGHPTERDLASDPIAARLHDGIPPEVRVHLRTIAARPAQSK
jgi:hypothetical protein